MIISNVIDVKGNKIDIKIDGNKIVEIKPAGALIGDLKVQKKGEKVQLVKYNSQDILVCNGVHILPAFIDMHVHLREPGYESKEDILTGTKAAVHGGFASVACMPNTNPVVDNEYIVKYIKYRAKEVNLAKVYPIGSVTKGQNGEELSDMLSMYNAGAKGFSDDGRPIMNANIMRLALEYTKDMPARVICHEEDLDLVNGGYVNEGKNATLTGLRGITRAAEEVQIARDLVLAETFKTKIHIAHVSTKGGVQLIREGKARGVDVTCESCPHYIALDDSILNDYDTNAKVNPPIREKDDQDAIVKGFIDGTIDCIVTDHAPHTRLDKDKDFQHAAFGISGIETSFALSYTNLVRNKKITLAALSDLMTKNPGKILGIEYGEIKNGGHADITLVDLDKKYKIDSTKFLSKGKNTPLNGMEVYGEIKATIVDGDIKFLNDEVIR